MRHSKCIFFAGKGKIRLFKVMLNSKEYIDLFSRVEMTEFVNEEMHEKIKDLSAIFAARNTKVV